MTRKGRTPGLFSVICIDKMEVKMNKEIQEFQESLFLWAEHAAVFLFCIGDCCCSRCLSRDKRYLWNGDCRMAECFCCSPFCGMWFFPLSPDDTGKVRMGVVKIRDLMPQKAGVSIGESLSEMSGRDNRNRNTFLQKWNGAGRTKEKQKLEKMKGRGDTVD